MTHHDTIFIGRHKEQEQLLGARHRIITVFGVAGVGKSTLLEHTAQQIQHAPVYLIDVSTIVDLASLVSLLAMTLDLPWQWPEHLSEEEVVSHFASMWHNNIPDVIVIMDNAEIHHEIIRSVLPWLIREHPGLQCLVGSRIALELDEEYVLALDPFETTSEQNPAIDLFFAHARHLKQPEQYIKDISRLVDGLNGLPLAIVLAANRSKWMLPQQLVSQLQEEHTQTTYTALNHAIDTSWQLLDEQARHHYMLCAISPFGIDVALGEHLFECDTEAARISLDKLTSHALLQKRGDDHWFMLHSIAMHAKGKLNAHPKGDDLKWKTAQHLGRLGANSYFEAAGSIYTGEPLMHYGEHLFESHQLAHTFLKSGVFPPEDCLEVITNTQLGLALVWHEQCALGRLKATCQSNEMLKNQMNAEQYAKHGLAFAVWASSNDAFELIYIKLHEHVIAHEWTPQLEVALSLNLVTAAKHAYDSERAEFHADIIERAIQSTASNAWKAQLIYSFAYHKVLTYQFEDAIKHSDALIELTESLGWTSHQAKALHLKAFTLNQLNQYQACHDALAACTQTYAKTNDYIAQAHVLELGLSFDIDQMQYQAARYKYAQLKSLFDQYRFFFLKGTLDLRAGQLAYAQDLYKEARSHFKAAHEYCELRQKYDRANICKLYLIMLERHDNEPGDTLESLESLHQQIEHLSFWIQSLVAGACIGVGVLAQEFERARRWQEILEPAREKHPLFDALGHIYDNCLRWITYEQYESDRRLTDAANTYRQILEALLTISESMSPTEPSLERMPLELRVGVDLFWAIVGPKSKARLLMDIQAPQLDALTMLRSQRAYRPPNQSAWVEYQRDAVPIKLLQLLADTHQHKPEQFQTSDHLCSMLWPEDQHEDKQTLTNRLYVALRTLKYDGLEGFIEHERQAGYRLRPDLMVHGAIS